MSRKIPQNLASGVAQRFVEPSAVRVFMQSPNQIADPYDPSANLWSRFKKFFVSAASFARIRQNLSGFGPGQFSKQALEQWKQINTHFSNQDASELRDLVSEHAFSKFKSAMKTLAGQKIQWSMPEVLDNRVVAFRVAKIQGTEDEFAQVTVKLQSKQSFAILDAKTGKLLRGSLEPTSVTEYLVFERNLNKKKEGRWLYIGKLDIKA
jgi:predicted lipid-binding transport protein (Tim44 family)